MTKSKNESLPLVLLGAVVLIVGGALYWFLGVEGSPIDVTTTDGEAGVVAEERGARRADEPPGEPVEDVSSRRTAESPRTNVLDRDSAGAASQVAPLARFVLSCRLEGVAADEVASYRIQPAPLQGMFGVPFTPPAADAMPADGSPLELDVTEMRDVIERGRGFVLVVTHSSGAEHRLNFDLGALPRRVEESRTLIDVIANLGEVSIVKGRIVSSDPEAVDLHLFVYPIEGDRPLLDAIRTASTPAQGRFEFMLDRTKEWLLVCSAAGYAPLSLRIPRHAEPVHDAGTLTLSRGEVISGIVTRLGVPQSGLRVRAFLEDPQRSFEGRIHIGGGQATWRDGRIMWSDLTAMTAADGSYRMTGLDRQRYDLTVESADEGKDEVHEALRSKLRREVVAPAGGVDFEIGGVKLKIRVRDESGPLQGWLMSLSTPDGKSWNASPIDETAVRTVYVPAETILDVAVSHEKYETFKGSISFPRSEASANYEVVMKPLRTARLRVRVRDHQALGIRSLGASVKGASLDENLPASHQMIRNFQKLWQPSQWKADIDAEGLFTFDDLVLAKGRHEFVFRPNGVGGFDDLMPVSVAVDIDPERENFVEIGFERGGHAKIGARDANGVYLEGRATIIDSAGTRTAADLEPMPFISDGVAESAPGGFGTDLLSSAGLLRSRLPLEKGGYRVEVEREDGSKRSAEFVIRAGETTEVVVVF